MCDADQEFECNFGFVGADSANGRVCVPYTPAEEVCGNDGQDVCAGVLPTTLVCRLPCFVYQSLRILYKQTGGQSGKPP